MNLSDAKLRKQSIHLIGNRVKGTDCFFSDSEIILKSDLATRLEPVLLGRFPSIPETYSFGHPSNLRFNEVYSFTKGIFQDESRFHEMSVNIGQHLFERTVHPRVGNSEMYVSLFDKCRYDDRHVRAIGIFKTETRQQYFDIGKERRNLKLSVHEGIDLSAFSKGCLIFDVEERSGFRVLVIDRSSPNGEEAAYWRDEFLHVVPLNNEFHQTAEFLSLAGAFISKEVSLNEDFNRADQIDVLNRSVQYFKAHSHFDIDEYEGEIFDRSDVRQSFRDYRQKVQGERNIDLPSQFEISPSAVKRQAKIFRSVLKLDNNFHIYIHGRRDLIEQGVESDGRKFYKFYYEEDRSES